MDCNNMMNYNKQSSTPEIESYENELILPTIQTKTISIMKKQQNIPSNIMPKYLFNNLQLKSVKTPR